MYGHIHYCIKAMVLDKFGQETWDEILNDCGIDDMKSFFMWHSYEDSDTVKIVESVAKVLDKSPTMVLELLGQYFYTFCEQTGYDKMLRIVGDNLTNFVSNLNSLHALLALSHKGIKPPTFRCESRSKTSLKLHHYSLRKGMHGIASGLIKECARRLFNQEVSMEVVEQDTSVLPDGAVQHHIAFLVNVIRDYSNTTSDEDRENGELGMFTYPEKFAITPEIFCGIFPYHVIFNRQLVIIQCGDNLQKLCPWQMRGRSFDEAFSVVTPRIVLTFDNILPFVSTNFIIQLKDSATISGSKCDKQSKRSLHLRGEMSWLRDSNQIMFIGSPCISSLNELMEQNLHISDIPLYDVTRELILMNHQRIAEIEISRQLDETTAELKRTAQALEEEKRQTDRLLYQMLPVKVADQLRTGQQVAAEKFEQATILFSDIVTFTNIAATVPPMEIVNLLNNLYSIFDQLTTKHDVYKVETIGDAYMVVGGVPVVSDEHAQSVADMAIDMVAQAQKVQSPATGESLQIRVGVHTGSVVAGVVGHKMPRYCLFGDTVNTASRMESHGIPGLIHCSDATYRELRDKNYHFTERGNITVKGKGKMTTYLLSRNGNNGAITEHQLHAEVLNTGLVTSSADVDNCRHIDDVYCSAKTSKKREEQGKSEPDNAAESMVVQQSKTCIIV